MKSNLDASVPGSATARRQDKPLLRGWFHAVAALGAMAATIGLLLQTRDDAIRLLSMLVFGLSMVELYTLSAVYHIGSWKGRKRTVLRALDHANIFVLIAGTYTPICVNVLSGWLRAGVLALIWALALAGVIGAVFTLRLPRWLATGLYIVMGWVSVAAAPELARVLSWEAVGLLVGGGVLYSIGAIIYSLKKPDPFPSILGYHEIFHLFVIAGSAVFLFVIWVWVVPFPRP